MNSDSKEENSLHETDPLERELRNFKVQQDEHENTNMDDSKYQTLGEMMRKNPAEGNHSLISDSHLKDLELIGREDTRNHENIWTG